MEPALLPCTHVSSSTADWWDLAFLKDVHSSNLLLWGWELGHTVLHAVRDRYAETIFHARTAAVLQPRIRSGHFVLSLKSLYNNAKKLYVQEVLEFLLNHATWAKDLQFIWGWGTIQNKFVTIT